MPKGVEHAIEADTARWLADREESVMPKGVEHKQRFESDAARNGEGICDAERR